MGGGRVREEAEAEWLPHRPRLTCVQRVRNELAAAATGRAAPFRCTAAAAPVRAAVNEAADAAELRDSPGGGARAAPPPPPDWCRRREAPAEAGLQSGVTTASISEAAYRPLPPRGALAPGPAGNGLALISATVAFIVCQAVFWILGIKLSLVKGSLEQSQQVR